MLTCLLGVSHHYFADLVGNLWPAATNQFIVDPSNNDNVAVPTVTEARTKLVMNVDQPAFADHRFCARYRVVERGVLCEHRDAPAVETRQPAAVRPRCEICTQLAY